MIGDTVRFGFNQQTRDSLDPNKAVWQEICGLEEHVWIDETFSMPARAFVSQFNFKGPAQNKLVSALSGGERNRLSLAKSLKLGCNVLLLDEPTNDLDVDTLRALEESVASFDGCAIIVSHDRYFLDRVATHILAFNEDGSWEFFVGSFSEYERAKRERLGADYAVKPRKFRKLATQ